MWFILSLTALLFWSGSDMFSKIGSHPSDKNSHWKMMVAIGLVMGLHAAFEVFVNGVTITLSDIIAYMPASALYILSMVIGYVGLRYIELSISTPICNSSGAVAALFCFIFLREAPEPLVWLGVLLVGVGIVSLGFVEMNEDDEIRALRQQKANIKYAKSFVALLLPILYCLIDAAGTVADTVILENLNEDVANVAYELTWAAVALVAAVYIFAIRREKPIVRREGPKLLAGVCETAGQLAYIYAIGDEAHTGSAAAIISAYCALSVIWSRIFLKEKLSVKHYISIVIAVCGIVLLGVFDA
ncbi:MAG: EamA family transporter [Clostridia bacterium]|nr:EamA family transporter [Clostridia bacterium]